MGNDASQWQFEELMETISSECDLISGAFFEIESVEKGVLLLDVMRRTALSWLSPKMAVAS